MAAADPGWLPSDTITVASVFVAASAGVFGAWLGSKWTRAAEASERKAAERFTLQREAFGVVGPIMAMLVDLHPDRLGMNAGPEMMELLKKQWARWTDDLRDRTFALSASYPDEKVRRVAGALTVAMHNANVGGVHTVAAILTNKDFASPLEDARAVHQAAQAACDELAALLRQDGIVV